MNEITKDTIDNLLGTNVKTTNIVVALSQEGYAINKCKVTRLNLGTILLHLYRSSVVDSKEYSENIKHFRNKIAML